MSIIFRELFPGLLASVAVVITTRKWAAIALLTVTVACGPWTRDAVSDSPAHAPAEVASVADPTAADPVADDDGPPLTRDEVRVVVRAKLPQVRACFDAGLARAGDLGGRIVLRFTIAADGRAAAIGVVEDELGAASGVADCLVDELTRWQFPRPRGGRELTINYPFVFSSEQSLRAAGLPRVEGTLDPAAVGAVFAARRDELDACIPSETGGTIGLALLIDDGGTVTRISSYASTLPESARACVVRTVSSWAFPPAASGDEVRVNHDLAWDGVTGPRRR